MYKSQASTLPHPGSVYVYTSIHLAAMATACMLSINSQLTCYAIFQFPSLHWSLFCFGQKSRCIQRPNTLVDF